MNIQKYLKSLRKPGRKALAEKLEVSRGYLDLLAYGKGRRASPALVRRIADESGGKVDLAKERPEIWGDPGTPPKNTEAA